MKSVKIFWSLLLICPSAAFSVEPSQVVQHYYLSKFQANTPAEKSDELFTSSMDALRARQTLVEFFAPSFHNAKPLKIVSDPFDDLDLFAGESGHILNKAFPAQTLFGEVFGALALVHLPTSDKDVIENRQSVIKRLVSKPVLTRKVVSTLAHMKSLQTEILDFYDINHPANGVTMTLLYQDETMPGIGKSAEIRNRTPQMIAMEFISGRYFGAIMALPMNYMVVRMTWNTISNIYLRGLFGLFQAYSTKRMVSAPFEDHSSHKELNAFLTAKLKVLGEFVNKSMELAARDEELPASLRFNLSSLDKEMVRVLIREINTLSDPVSDGAFFQMNLGRVAAALRLVFELRKDLLVRLMIKVGALDFYSAVAAKLLEQDSGFCFTTVGFYGPFVSAKELRNPLLDKNVAIPSDVDLGLGKPHNFVITGHNASGKSTYMRAIGIGILFSQLIGVAPAKEMHMSVFTMFNTFMKNTDAVGERSSFQTEVAANRGVMNLYKNMKADEYAFMISDEPFRSTNMEDATAASHIVFHNLCTHRNVMFLVATHLENLTGFKGAETCGLVNKHMEPKTYQLVDGVSTSTNALVLLRKRLDEC